VKTNFGGEGNVSVSDGAIRMDWGETLTGITYQGEHEHKTSVRKPTPALTAGQIDALFSVSMVEAYYGGEDIAGGSQ